MKQVFLIAFLMISTSLFSQEMSVLDSDGNSPWISDVIINGAFLRETPDPKGTVIRKVKTDRPVAVVKTKGHYSYVCVQGVCGYVHRADLSNSGNHIPKR
jgi:SH3-like domain-containing protein